MTSMKSSSSEPPGTLSWCQVTWTLFSLLAPLSGSATMLPTSPRTLSGATRPPTYAMPTDQRRKIDEISPQMHRERVPTWLQDRQDQHFGHTALLKSFQSARKCLSFKLVTISRSSFSPSTCRAPHQPHRPVISSIISLSDICNTCFASYP